jgi:serine/threonine protein kinase
MRDLLDWVRVALGDQYAIERELGRGGTATVYVAEDLKHRRKVALKVLRPELAALLGSDRFLREIEIAAKLRHPHILPLFDSGEIDGLLYQVMPYVEGASLRELLEREKRLALDDALRITRQVADGLGYAHSLGIVHRDVKPENILFEAGHAVVTDFGIARAVSEARADRLTDTGIVVGTPTYMSPEQAGGAEELDARSDLYSLACVLFEMLTGDPPFTASTAQALVARKSVEPPPKLRVVRPAVPESVEAAVARALATLSGDRFATVGAFVGALTAPVPAGGGGAPVSIAVLPFANVSADLENDYLGDGIAEEITNALTKVRALRVASRTSAFAFKRQTLDIRTIGQQLGVATVLEGSVRRAGNQLRITAQLVDVANGYHLWSERYDREMEDVFVIEDEIARNIAGALSVILSEEEKQVLKRVPTSDVKAYEFYLRGRQFFAQARKKSLEYARDMFTRAIQLDPEYALAYAGVADSCSMLHMYYPSSEPDTELADSASRKALELGPELAEAHASRGFALFQMQRLEEAEREFREAMELDPKQYEARYFYARTCFQQGRFEQAAQLFEAAAQAREDYQSRFFAAQSYAAMGREAEAESAYRRAMDVATQHLELNPDDPRAATMVAVSYCRLGEPEKGLEWAERATAIDPEDAGVRYNVACLYSLEGETEKAVACLEEAVERGFGNASWIEHDPDLDPVRDHPRFAVLLERVASGGEQP